MSVPARVSVIDSEISDCDFPMAVDVLEARLRDGEGGYVCFTNVHTAVLGRQNPKFRAATNGSLLSVADGKPVHWVGRARGGCRLSHMPGPDFMLNAMRYFHDRRHFFYGSTPSVVAKLVQRLQRQIPGLQVCGTLSPPFRGLTRDETQSHYATIRDSAADFVWVGLGAPKQEFWMAEAWLDLKPAILLGVGAAFDFHAGSIRRAPASMRAVGLEWLHRLLQEPRRLWRRYLVANCLFIGYVLGDALSGR